MTTPPDPLLAALFDRLPEPGAPFDPFDRTRWLTALAACLDIVYGPQPRPAADPPADDDPDGPRRRPAGQRTPCGRCGLMLSPQGRSAHEAIRPGMTAGLLVVGLVTDVEHSLGEVRLRFAVTFGGGQPIELVVQPDHPAHRIHPHPKGTP